MSDYDQRFSGIARLYSQEGLKRIQKAHVCVIGIGGVGSWAVEGLARSGIGKITMIDLDDICISNVNRQLHALDGEIGQLKVDAMAKRIQLIHPDIEIQCVPTFLTEKNLQELLNQNYDYVIDAIDSLKIKCLLIAHCRRNKISLITTGGAGGRQDPTAVQVTDLSKTWNDKLLHKTRKKLRQEFNFPRNEKRKFGIACVYSPEDILYPQSDGSVCKVKEDGSELGLNCDNGYGTASFVTGTFGFAAASYAIKKIASSKPSN